MSVIDTYVCLASVYSHDDVTKMYVLNAICPLSAHTCLPVHLVTIWYCGLRLAGCVTYDPADTIAIRFGVGRVCWKTAVLCNPGSFI